MMTAIWQDTVIAEADKKDLIYIEGNWYFPADKIKKEYFEPSSTRTTCYWKGEASYFNVKIGQQINQDAAWYYPSPIDSSIEKVKKDFKDYVAFWRGVQVVDQ